MSTNDKNKKAFSYKAFDRRRKQFLNKNFNKSSSYMSNFSETLFSNTSFIGTKFKVCSFYGARFNGCLFQGTLFKKCNLRNAIFENTIIISSIFENVKLKDCRFYNCIIMHNNSLKSVIPENNICGTSFLNKFPDNKNFNQDLIAIIKKLRLNNYIRRSGTLHRKKGLLNTISIEILVSEFGEMFLINNLEKISNIISNDFHTLSYIQNLLRKIKNNNDII